MSKTLRRNTMAVLNYQDYDALPCVHFGAWDELYHVWHAEGHISDEDMKAPDKENRVFKKLGFDYGWYASVGSHGGLMPGFEYRELSRDGEYVTYVNGSGMIERSRPGAESFAQTIGTLLTDRKAFEELYLPKLQPSPARYNLEHLKQVAARQDEIQDRPFGIHVGSLYGCIRDMLGVEALSYLYYDDEELFADLINAVADVCYTNLEAVLGAGIRPDFGHFWEDICFKNGPLVKPDIFREFVGPHYSRLTDLLAKHGCELSSLDCDGDIDLLVPIWLENGVNIMFPIEYGTWEATIIPWREKYGRGLRGVGGMNKLILAGDYSDVDAELERLKAQIDLGGFIPCPDHRLPPDAKWKNVQYYCDRFKRMFQ
ncbi:MAG: hypothetical protein GX827_09200 [Clostridiales bacterium]|jgi:hypothetical protein|nr:hypothetical protein [Clostridiales bacterium]